MPESNSTDAAGTEGSASGSDSPLEALDALIRSGESDRLEFKSSLRYDLQTRSVNKELTRTVVKVVASFLNTRGGTLLIGISDDGTPLGLDPDIQTLSKKSLDGLELTLRNAIGTYLSPSIAPNVLVTFPSASGAVVAQVTCPRHVEPVFLREGDQYTFYVRDGNQTRPLNLRDAHSYIRTHWPEESAPSPTSIKSLVAEAIRDELGAVTPDALRAVVRSAVRESALSPPKQMTAPAGEAPPPWMRVGTRRVLNLFLRPLAQSTGWKRIYLVTPWISDIDSGGSMTSDQFIKRLKDDRTTVYLVTRPPEHDWHDRAIKRLGETGRVNIALVPQLHVKLYTASTAYGSFAMIGSANFTQQSLASHEIAVLIDSYADGRRVVSDLQYEASQLYHLQGRKLLYQASFADT
ncbi:MAG: RNA-binding domain-containing protein [Solirubrobacteraceae bacterium]